MTIPLARAVRGVAVRSRKSPGNCAPDWGYAVLDFEPIPAGESSSVEFACAPCPDRELGDALAEGALTELAGTGTHDPARRRGDPVSARVVVRVIEQSEVDSCAAVYRGLGVLAVREMLNCLEQDREPQPIITRISIGFRP
ncbi:hypothetical protein ACFXHA_04180 [Nocardia sp. NPDC059240]|uniref:hypothetical protein n=1 Tax=Nocardia sp. NPDC059240 TaxID=3346786 RepID=UPI00368426C8